MTVSFSRRALLGGAIGLLAGTGGMSLAKAPRVSLRPRARPEDLAARTAPGAEDLIVAAQLGGRVSFAVMDVRSGRTMESHEAKAGQPPASVTKAVTALYALGALGAGHRFETRLVATGGVGNGVVRGDLVLVGGGDPTLDTDALGDLAAALKRAGIREVRGKLRIWSGILPFEAEIDATQPDHVGYNPALSGLSLNFNRVHFEWKRAGGSYSVSMDARSKRYRPDVRVARMQVANRERPVYTYRDKGDHDSWTVARGALGNGGARWLPVRKPEAYAAEVFATLARAHGIVLRYGGPVGAAPAGDVLALHRSTPLRDILRGMLKYSNNLTAELVGMAASRARSGRPASLRASAREMSRWARQELGMRQASFVDHSGLGAGSRLTAGEMAQALVAARGQSGLKAILKDIPMRDARGRIDRGHPVKVSAKTGTLYFVSSLAGYMTAPDGTELAFAIFAANPGLRRGIDRDSGQRPAGASSWNGRAKRLQQQLIERWGRVYGS